MGKDDVVGVQIGVIHSSSMETGQHRADVPPVVFADAARGKHLGQRFRTRKFDTQQVRARPHAVADTAGRQWLRHGQIHGPQPLEQCKFPE